jgi:lipopolysaccharide export system protein LptA
VADIAFRNAGKGKVEPATIHGMDGVSVVATSQRGSGPAVPEKLTADEVTGEFGENGALTKLTGRGHTSIAETTASGTQESMSGDRLEAHLAAAANAKESSGAAPTRGEMQIESATVNGNVVLTEKPAAKAGVEQAVMRATAGRADYDNVGQWLHLSENPSVTDGGLELTSDKLNVSQESGDAVAQGNVKATWIGDAPGTKRDNKSAGSVNANFGAQGPTHVIAESAELRHSTGAATFKGKVRLWQQGNSVNAPVIVLDRTKQTLVAQTTSAKNPVQVVMVSATAAVPGAGDSQKQKDPSVVSVRGGELKYSSAERKAVMRAGVAGRVVSSTADATTYSNELELTLLPPGNHAGKDGAPAQVDRMTSTGRVEISAGGRHGSGEQLVYTSDNGKYVLTGTAATPPQLTDPTRGTVTGQALIFSSRDDSVSIEGDGRKTTTVTTAPK